MKIGLFYDTLSDHALEDNNFYFDFSSKEEVDYVKKKLLSLGHSVTLISNIKDFIRNIDFYKNNLDIIFNMYEGIKSRNRESLVPAICETFDIPYTGSDAFGMALTLNKFFLRLYASTLEINVPQCIRVTDSQQLASAAQEWSIYPCVIKPEHEGSSMGVSIIQDKEQLYYSTNDTLNKYNEPVLIEQYIEGIEVSVCIIETNGIPEVVSIKQFSMLNGDTITIFDRNTKKITNHESFVSNLPHNQLEILTTQSKEIFRSLPLFDVARIDWRVTHSGKPYLLEVTPLPDWQPEAEFERNGVDLSTTLNQILLNALRRNTRDEN